MNTVKIFFSYCFDDEAFVEKVNSSLVQQPLIKTFFYPEERRAESWVDSIEDYLKDCHGFVLFMGTRLGQTQKAEALKAQEYGKRGTVVLLPASGGETISARGARTRLVRMLPVDLNSFMDRDPICVSDVDETEQCAREIVARLGLLWDSLGIPNEYPFEYEKDIIHEYLHGDGQISEARVAQGCPRRWPDVDRRSCNRVNPVPSREIGAYRDWDETKDQPKDPRVIVAALSDYHQPQQRRCPLDMRLTFAEAGPRKEHFFPRRGDNLTVGIVVSGGIAPGLNALIAGVVSRHILYFDAMKSVNGTLKFHCYREGFNSLIQERGEGPDYEFYRLTKDPRDNDDRQDLKNLCQQAYRGGTVIPTARTEALMEIRSRRRAFSSIVSALQRDGIELLYVIGGDGSMRAAHAIQRCAQEQDLELSVVAVPKTMDNDILWVWQSFGFPSAVEWAKDAVSHLHTEATSNPRLCVIQLFGSDSGFVVCHAALASGACDLVLIPEVDFEIGALVNYVKEILHPRHRLGMRGRSPYGIILMAETAIPRSFKEHRSDSGNGFALDDPDLELSDLETRAIRQFFDSNRRVHGQTPDELRRAGLKIVVGAAKKAISALSQEDGYWKSFRVFTNEPRHLLRAIPPSASDILFAKRLGSLAVDGAMAGFRDFMISQWLTEYVMVPLSLVVLGRKRVPRTGIFWKSVLASTQQPANMT
jgi:6-phosphofructokinase 1